MAKSWYSLGLFNPTQTPSPKKPKAKKLTVQAYCINKGTKSEYFGLMMVEGKEKTVLHYAPNNWKTERGALNWAKKRGYDVKVPARRRNNNG